MAKSYCVVPAYRESVRLAIDKTGKSLEVLAGEVGITKPTLTNFRDGINILQSNFISLSEKLGLDWQEIAGLTTVPTPATSPSSPEPPNNIPISGVREGGFFGRRERLENMAAPTYTVPKYLIEDIKTDLQAKGITQSGLAEMAGKLREGHDEKFSRDTVEKFLNGEPVATDKFISICTVLEFDHRTIASELPYYPPHEIFPSGAKEFVGRETLIEELHRSLTKNQIVSACGIGGIGKTELSIRYASKYLKYYQGGICSIRSGASSNLSASTQIESFAINKLSIEPSGWVRERSDVDRAKLYLDKWTKGSVLFIFDDVEHFNDEIYPLLPLPSRFRILLTTRLVLDSPCVSFPVNELDRSASLKLLSILIERIEEESLCDALCAFMGDLPLGIELGGRYLKNNPDIPLARYLERLQKKAKTKEALTDISLVGNEKNPTWTLTAKCGVLSAFDLSWEKLDIETKILGVLLGGFPATSLPWELVEATKEAQVEDTPEYGGEYDYENLLVSRDKLREYSLLKILDDGYCKLHPLIREFFRYKSRTES
jgi:transcriptional regulator with XRE-family HTH domain